MRLNGRVVAVVTSLVILGGVTIYLTLDWILTQADY